MTVVSRLQLDHPALGAAGGAGLHASIEAIYTKIGNNIATRILVAVNLNDTATATVQHDLNTNFADLRYDLYLYDETTGELTRITSSTSPSLSQFTIAATSGFLKTKIDITNNSGAQRDLALIVYADAINLSEGDVKDIDVTTTAPQDGQALVYEASSSKWKPGASGDASFKIQTVSDPNATIKGGYIDLDDGRTLATYDGSGGASTDYGTDITVDLDAILGTNPANATTYGLYVDLEALGAEVTLSDNGRKVYGVTVSQLKLFTTLPSGSINRARYVPIGFIKSATTGTVWSGSGSAFGTFATRKHDNGPVAVNPVTFTLVKQAVGSVGSSGQVAAGHILTLAKSFPSSLASQLTKFSFYNLAANANDGNTTNAKNLTNNGTITAFGATGILGGATAVTLNGTTQYFSSTDAFFNPGNGKSFAVVGWFKATDWTPSGQKTLFSNQASGTDRGFYAELQTNGDIVFVGTNTAASTDAVITVSNPGFTDATWHHIALVYDFSTTTLKAYIDGRLAGAAGLANQRSLTSSVFRVGAVNAATVQFFAGEVEEVLFVNDYLLVDEDVRKLYSYRYDHFKDTLGKNQEWTANLYTTVSGCASQDDQTWIVCKGDKDSVFWDFGSMLSTDQVEVFMKDIGFSANVVPVTPPYDSGELSTLPTLPITHGLGGVPTWIQVLYESSTGQWDPQPVVGALGATSTQITGTLSGIPTVSASNKVCIIAGIGANPNAAVAEYNATRAGTTNTSRQNASGLKGFLGGAYSVGNVRASEGAGTTTLTDDDNRHQVFNLSAARTVVLPTTSIKAGDVWVLENRGAFDLSVQSSDTSPMTIAGGANIDATIQKGFVVLRALQDAPTTETHWRVVEVQETASYTTTYNFDGGGSASAARTVTVNRQNTVITLGIDVLGNATTGTSSTRLSSDTAMATRFRPNTSLVGTPSAPYPTRTANVNASSPLGMLVITGGGLIQLYKDATGSATFTNAQANSGFGNGVGDMANLTYINGTGG